ncbi:transporter substrate-binding domain-containing protein [Streptomyces sp. SID3343]|uniref:transporter substrate-binding domain-containing protein n=1 Tax=Streptomyces sp. SID3343 TaxID=2690260 RepID=UPI001368F9C2|nr:transporter substrate-binding domain-containing protein [Streptomyces sp. SID3343]MYW04302.1 transporter substrate-binding domain-containing protein [Streptomyces sp. SID3343]
MRSGRRRTVATILPALTLVACSYSPASQPGVPGPSARVSVSGARPALPQDYPAPSSAPACDPRESLSPLSPLPTPGQMPAGSTMEKILRRGYLIVGVDQNTRYFAELDTRSGRIKGFDIDIADRLATAIFGGAGPAGEHIRYKVITQAQRPEVIRDRVVDVVIDTMTITCDRKVVMAFGSDYYTDGQRVMIRDDTDGAGVTSLADLRGKRVCTVRLTTSIAYLRDDPAHVLPYAADNWTDCLVALQQGEVDAVSTTSALLKGLAAQDEDMRVVGPVFTDEPHGMAFPLADKDFVRFANALLEQLKQNGEWQRLYDTWLKEPLGAQSPPRAIYSG